MKVAVHADTYTMCVYTQVPKSTLCIFLDFSPPIFFMTVSFSEPVAHLLATLPRKRALGMCLPLCPQQCVYQFMTQCQGFVCLFVSALLLLLLLLLCCGVLNMRAKNSLSDSPDSKRSCLLTSLWCFPLYNESTK